MLMCSTIDITAENRCWIGRLASFYQFGRRVVVRGAVRCEVTTQRQLRPDKAMHAGLSFRVRAELVLCNDLNATKPPAAPYPTTFPFLIRLSYPFCTNTHNWGACRAYIRPREKSTYTTTDSFTTVNRSHRSLFETTQPREAGPIVPISLALALVSRQIQQGNRTSSNVSLYRHFLAAQWPFHNQVLQKGLRNHLHRNPRLLQPQHPPGIEEAPSHP